MENIHVLGNKANFDRLTESKAQLEKGKSGTHELIEVDLLKLTLRESTKRLQPSI